MKPALISIAGTLCLTLGWPCAAQTGSTATDPVQALQSADPIERANAFEALQRAPGALAAPRMAGVLLHVLEREDQLLSSTLRDPSGVSVDEKYGEGFAEYLSALLEACNQYCNKHDPKTIEALASGAYSPGSPFAQQLAAEHGPELVALMLERTRTGVSVEKNDAVVMLGNIARGNRGLPTQQRALLDSAVLAAAADRSSFLVRQTGVRVLGDIVRDDRGLSAQQRARIHDGVVAAIADTYTGVRLTAIRVLGNVGGPKDLAMLRQLAESDTVRSVSHGKVTYPVREEAQRAMAKISPP